MRKALFFVSLLAPFAAALAAVDFSPTPSEYKAEGITFRQLSLKDGDRTVMFEPPREWTERGSATELQLTPRNREDALASVHATPLGRPESFDDASLQKIEQDFVASLPPQSQHVEVVSRAQSPVLVDGNPTFEVIASYEVLGRTFQRSLLVARLGDSQLSFRLVARKLDFDALHHAWCSSILSWHWR